MHPPRLNITGDPDADELLTDNPLALMIGMLLDQQISIELAFIGPHRLRQRLDGSLDPATVSRMPPDELEAVFREKPALHRFPANMAKRTAALCQTLVRDYGGEPSQVWADVADGSELRSRLLALPGFGEEKASIFIALLAKRFDVRPPGWEEAAGVFASDGLHSVADVDGAHSLAELRERRRALKAAGKDKQGRATG